MTRNPNFPRRTRTGYSSPAKIWYEDYKRSVVCAICGESDPLVLTQHHTHPENKKYTIARMVSAQMSLLSLKREIAKTVPLCNNCHTRIHWHFNRGSISSLAPAELSRRHRDIVSGKVRVDH